MSSTAHKLDGFQRENLIRDLHAGLRTDILRSRYGVSTNTITYYRSKYPKPVPLAARPLPPAVLDRLPEPPKKPLPPLPPPVKRSWKNE